MHCKYILFEDKKKSTRPKGITPLKLDSQEYIGIIAVLTCVEKWDKIEDVDNYVNIVLDYIDLTKNKSILIVPFAHLSHNLAKSKEAIEILSLICENLRVKGCIVNESSFGYHKIFNFELVKSKIYEHPGSVAYRQFPINIDDELINNILTFGIENSYQLINQLRREKNANIEKF